MARRGAKRLCVSYEGKRRMETNPLDSFQLCRLYEQTLGKGGF